MVVELCGVPGGGKSTLARTYNERYGEDAELIALDMYAKWPTIVYSCVYALRHPLSFGWLLLFIARYHVRGLFRYSLHLGLRACAKYSIASHSHKKIALIDEGLVHVLCVTSRKLLTEKEMSMWVSRITMPDIVGVVPSGDFPRFHDERAPLHPRVQQGADALNTWEGVVRGQVAHVATSLETQGIRTWLVPLKEVSSANEIADALHVYISSSHE